MKEYWSVEIHEFLDLQVENRRLNGNTMVMVWLIYLQYFFLYFFVFC